LAYARRRRVKIPAERGMLENILISALRYMHLYRTQFWRFFYYGKPFGA
jgi:hypothetical protein